MRSTCPDCGGNTVPKRTGSRFCSKCRKCDVCGSLGANNRGRNGRESDWWCGACLQRWRRTRNPQGRERLYRASVQDRFWFYVGPPNPITGCREWLAGRGPKGYGIFRYSDSRRTMGAHRAALIFTKGHEIKDAHVLHSCDNPGCVEPTHLRWGTNADNMADRVQREGYTKSKRLTPEQVLEIKKLLAKGKLSQSKIGKLYGVSHEAVGKISRGETWRYL